MATQSAPLKSHARQLVACRVCLSDDHARFLEAGEFQIVRCKGCGFWFVNPQPSLEELKDFYAEYDEGIQWRGKENHFNRGICKAIFRFRQGGELLDIGSGAGNFLRCMRDAGFSVLGIEPSQSGCDYARSENAIETFHGMMEDYLAVPQHKKFDVVTILNVLEHLTDPERTLLQIRQLMKPDALLAIVVPNADFHATLGKLRRWLRIADPYWLERPVSFICGFKPPHHLSSFTPRTLTLLLRRCGFRIETLTNAPVIFNPGVSRNIGKILVRSASQTLYHLSRRRFAFGYSTLALSSKLRD
jgi:2-polyprenyl-3-methyl-5-hydroxy-6-metoxy-1,4-benzoquinol methylase